MAAAARAIASRLDFPSLQVEWLWTTPCTCRGLEQVRGQGAGERGLELAHVLPELGRDVGIPRSA